MNKFKEAFDNLSAALTAGNNDQIGKARMIADDIIVAAGLETRTRLNLRYGNVQVLKLLKDNIE